MPVVLSVHGIVESYPVQTGPSRPPRVESVEASGDQPGRRLPQERSAQDAQAAYEQQTRQEQPLKPAVLACDLMTAPVVTLPSDGTLVDAWELMKRRGVRHIPVTSVHGALVGMVSDRDLLRYVPELVLTGNSGQAAHHRLAAILSPRLISATPVTPIREIARVMVAESIHAVPILDAQRRPIGIVTAQDLLRGIAQHGPLELWT